MAEFIYNKNLKIVGASTIVGVDCSFYQTLICIEQTIQVFLSRIFYVGFSPNFINIITCSDLLFRKTYSTIKSLLHLITFAKRGLDAVSLKSPLHILIKRDLHTTL